MSVCGEIENIQREITQVESLIQDAHHDSCHTVKNKLIAQVEELEKRLHALEAIS